jgi:hypothetical protein
MLEPLLDAEHSGFLDRTWEEIRKRDQRAFIEASVMRERILLRRLPDIQRAREVTDPRWRERLPPPAWPTDSLNVPGMTVTRESPSRGGPITRLERALRGNYTASKRPKKCPLCGYIEGHGPRHWAGCPTQRGTSP